MKNEINYKQNRITMISLVVTIIVLLILASIGIMAVTGDNGILSPSIKAKNEAEQSSKNIVENEENFIGDINQDIRYYLGNNIKKRKRWGALQHAKTFLFYFALLE